LTQRERGREEERDVDSVLVVLMFLFLELFLSLIFVHSSLLSLLTFNSDVELFLLSQVSLRRYMLFWWWFSSSSPSVVVVSKKTNAKKKEGEVSSLSDSISKNEQQRRQEEEEEEEQTTKTKREGFRFIQSFIEADKNDDKKKYYQVSYPNLAISAALVTVFSSVFTASVVHWKNRKHKLERDLSIGVHAKASIQGLKALAVATGFSLSLVSVLFASTNYIGLWEKEHVGRRIESALRSVPGGEVFKGPSGRTKS
tara:strand:+ start:216 stop:980 length:765 start_codon:yes stop_codon:yes gene_type:complete